jgi:hypothetical protein
VPSIFNPVMSNGAVADVEPEPIPLDGYYLQIGRRRGPARSPTPGVVLPRLLADRLGMTGDLAGVVAESGLHAAAASGPAAGGRRVRAGRRATALTEVADPSGPLRSNCLLVVIDRHAAPPLVAHNGQVPAETTRSPPRQGRLALIASAGQPGASSRRPPLTAAVAVAIAASASNTRTHRVNTDRHLTAASRQHGVDHWRATCIREYERRYIAHRPHRGIIISVRPNGWCTG